MDETGTDTYQAMFRSLVGRVVLVSLLPLIVIGGANFYLFYNLNRSIVIQQHANSLRNHRESIEAFLRSLTIEVSALAHQYSLEELKAGALERIFRIVQQRGGALTDMGIIDAQGHHLRYVGPYDLAGKNYRDTDWFRHVVQEGVYISDTFMGFRNEPHFIIAVKRLDQDGFWIFRATVNTDYFSKLVDAARIGETGETFIVNRSGLYQTKTRSGAEPLSPSGYLDLTPHEDIQVQEVTVEDKEYIYTTTWLTNPQWLLIFRQEVSDVYSPLWKASFLGLAMFLLGAVGATALAIVVARAQVERIRKADAEKEALTQQLIVAGKTAAVGEMSAGLAHEINNPLATIDTLQTLIGDMAATTPIVEEDRVEILESATKIGQQVTRCKTITQGLLKFSRRVDSRPENVHLSQLLEELATISRARAKVENVTLETDLGAVLPVFGSPAHLQQIFVNLVNNALDAVAGKPDGKVTIRCWFEAGKVKATVSDNGCGIASEKLSSIFLPFFTTKPVGKGTGLGLAICYGLMQDLGGTINVESTVGVGTTFIVELPVGEVGEDAGSGKGASHEGGAARPAAGKAGGRA